MLTWAGDDPEGRADTGGIEGSTEREGVAGGNGEDAAAAF